MLEVAGLEVAYGDLQVLWGTDLEVGDGEIVAIVGSNGAGKSTLLRSISGLLPIKAGAIRLRGERVDRLRPDEIVARGIVHVPEGRRLFAGMSIADNLLMGAYGRRDRRRGDVRADLERMYALFPVLGERRAGLAGLLSGGEQQMCAIARGLMAHPKLLMIDELSLGLAPVVVEELVRTLVRAREQGVTVLLVEQDLQHALEIADRGYVIEAGRIVMRGRAAELLADPAIRGAYLGL